MKIKLAFMFVFAFCICQRSSAQLKHYFAYNLIFFKDYFNSEHDKSYFPKNILIPNLSYKVEREKVGFEIFCNDGVGVEYYGFGDLSGYPIKQNSNRNILSISSFNVGVACHYNVVERKEIKINPFIGLLKNWYSETTLIGLGYHSKGWLEAYFGGNRESRIGLLLGININIPIWKGLYANTNTRYMVFPGAQYNKQNLVFDFGLGYMYQNKVKKK